MNTLLRPGLAASEDTQHRLGGLGPRMCRGCQGLRGWKPGPRCGEVNGLGVLGEAGPSGRWLGPCGAAPEGTDAALVGSWLLPQERCSESMPGPLCSLPGLQPPHPPTRMSPTTGDPAKEGPPQRPTQERTALEPPDLMAQDMAQTQAFCCSHRERTATGSQHHTALGTQHWMDNH